MQKISKGFLGILLLTVILPFNFIREGSSLSSPAALADSNSVSFNPISTSNDPNNLGDLKACENFSRANSQTKKFKYVLDGKEGEISATFYPGLNDCLKKLKRETSCVNCEHAKGEDQDDKDMINNIAQNQYLKELADKIKEVTSDKNDQARIAISLVQGLPYEDPDPDEYDYPYVTAFNKTGICNETGKLAIILLRHLGFGTAIFTFEKDDHQAFGIKCDSQYDYQNTGYCFVEPTTRAIISDNVEENTPVRVNKISDGLTFDAKKDYQEAQEYISLVHKKNPDTQEKLRISELKKKYGLGEKDKIA